MDSLQAEAALQNSVQQLELQNAVLRAEIAASRRVADAAAAQAAAAAAAAAALAAQRQRRGSVMEDLAEIQRSNRAGT
jgi:hypothetical protein